jgi:hypothetical protein
MRRPSRIPPSRKTRKRVSPGSTTCRRGGSGSRATSWLRHAGRGRFASRDGKTTVTDGPFTETKEAVGGFDLLECDSLEEAVEIAANHPLAQTGAIEVRPLWGN